MATTYGTHLDLGQDEPASAAFLGRRLRLVLGVVCAATLSIAVVALNTAQVAPVELAQSVDTSIAMNDGTGWTQIITDGLGRDINDKHTVTRYTTAQGDTEAATLAACQAACDASTPAGNACHMISFKTGDCRLTGTYSPSRTAAAPVPSVGFNSYIPGVITEVCDDKWLSSTSPSSDVSSSGSHCTPGSNGVLPGERNCCKNGMSDRGACAAWCAKDDKCNGFWFYESGGAKGRCCPKDSWSSSFQRHIPDGGFYSMKCHLPDCAAGEHRDGDNCVACAAGKFWATVGQQQSCTACEAGKSSAAGASSCDNCVAGKFALGAGSSACTDCAIGKFSNAGNTACTACADGKIAAAAAATECVDCAAGKFGRTASVCGDCVPGRFSSSAASESCAACGPGKSSVAAATACVDCVAGKFAAGHAPTACADCAAGSFSGDEGNFECQACAAGKFSAADAIECTECATGTFAKDEGMADCVDCTAGKYSAATGAVACTDCEAGKTSTAGAACADCASGTYSDKAGMAACTACARIPDVAPTVKGEDYTPTIVSTWAIGDRAWSDRTYPWLTLGDYTPANYQYKVKTSVTKRCSGMRVELYPTAGARCYEVTVVSETTASNTSANLNPGPPNLGSSWVTGCATGYPTYTAKGNTYAYNYCRKTTICAGEGATIQDSPNKAQSCAGDGKYEVYFKAVDPATC